MIKKVLIANRGGIAVRIIRTCRDMGVDTVAIYEKSDLGSLHVLLADECIRLDTAEGYTDQEQLLKLALCQHADAIHPGYGFLSESAEFADACAGAGLTFIGPSSQSLKNCASRVEMMQIVVACGMQVLEHSRQAFDPEDMDGLNAAAADLGYPVYVKALKGGSGRASCIAMNGAELQRSVELSSRKGQLFFGEKRVYLEKALLPVRTIQVQFLADGAGNVLTLGTVDVSMLRHGTRFLCESPAPGLAKEAEIRQSTETLVKKIKYQGLGAVEFLLDPNGEFYFLELQPRIQSEHSLIELLSGLDLVQEQIRIANGAHLPELRKGVGGVAMQCRLYAEDLLRQSLPSPGLLSRFRLPGGPNVRVDAYGYAGCQIPIHFDPLLATISSWGASRQECLQRMRRSLRDTAITGVKTNLAHLQSLLHDGDFVSAEYNSSTAHSTTHKLNFSKESNSKIAAIAAIAFTLRAQRTGLHKPERLSGGWHSSSRSFD